MQPQFGHSAEAVAADLEHALEGCRRHSDRHLADALTKRLEPLVAERHLHSFAVLLAADPRLDEQ